MTDNLKKDEQGGLERILNDVFGGNAYARVYAEVDSGGMSPSSSALLAGIIVLVVIGLIVVNFFWAKKGAAWAQQRAVRRIRPVDI